MFLYIYTSMHTKSIYTNIFLSIVSVELSIYFVFILCIRYIYVNLCIYLILLCIQIQSIHMYIFLSIVSSNQLSIYSACTYWTISIFNKISIYWATSHFYELGVVTDVSYTAPKQKYVSISPLWVGVFKWRVRGK